MILLLLLVPRTTITKTTIEIAKTNAKNNCNDYYNNRRALHEQMGCLETIKHNAPWTKCWLVGSWLTYNGTVRILGGHTWTEHKCKEGIATFFL